MKEILKILCQIYILIKKVIILMRIQVTVKIFIVPFFNNFSLSVNRTKCVVMRATIKKLNIFVLQVPILTYKNRKSVQMQTLQKQSDRNRLSLLQRGRCNAYCFG